MFKRLVCFAVGCLIAAGVAVAARETVYLKNGSIIKGDVIEETPGVSLKIRTGDGSIFVYQMSEIEKIIHDTRSADADDNNSRHRKLDFSVMTGVNIATQGGGTNVPVELTLSKRFSPYFSAGIGAGVEIGTGSGSRPIIPIVADFKGFLPLHSTKITPFASFRAGYAINTADSYTVGSGRYKTTVEQPNYIVISIMPGVRIPLSDRVDFDFALGYQHYVSAGSGGSGSGAFGIRAGFNFHAPTRPGPARAKKVNPIWDSGLEIGIEGSGISEYGGSVLIGYKWSPRLSLALGIGATHSTYDVDQPDLTYYSQPDAGGDVVGTDENDYDNSFNSNFLKIFIRGQYRFTDRKFAPFASIDLGYTTDTYKDNILLYHPTKYNEYLKEKAKGLFVRPAVGVSMRMGSNSYLELRAGYNFTPSVPKNNVCLNETGTLYRKRYESVRITNSGKGLSDLFVALSYKHTFSLFSRH